MMVEVRILLSLVLTVYFVCDHSIECRPERKVDTEITMNNTVNRVHKRNTCCKGCRYDNAPICGRTLVITTYYKREINDSGVIFDDDIDDDPDMDKILGGTYATYGEIPSMVNLLYEDQVFCGGAIINEFWIITAAHCFLDTIHSHIKIVVGDHRLNFKDAKEAVHKVDQIIFPPQYYDPNTDWDIALIKVKVDKKGRGIKFNNYVQSICVAESTEEPPVGTPMTFSGWGFTYAGYDPKPSAILKKSILPVIKHDTCKYIYPRANVTNMFCAGTVNGDIDMCGGDSGGPADYRPDESFILYGVGVTGTGCEEPNYPPAFGSIPKYRAWIDTSIRLYSSDSQKLMPVRGFHVVLSL